MSLIQDLEWRHAVKAYDPTKKVSEKDLNTILEAARLAPTSSGLQPFRVIVVENQELKEKMVQGALNPEVMRDSSHVLVLQHGTVILTKKSIKFMIIIPM
jgi:nitroreductase